MEISEIRKSVKDFEEQNKRTNKLQTDRINELIAHRKETEQKLLLSQQTNQGLTAQINNFKSTMENIENDKKLWKETLNNLREQCNDLTFKLNECNKNHSMNMKQ